MTDRRNPAEMKAVIARIEALEGNLTANTEITAATRKDIHDLRGESHARMLHMQIIEKSISLQTASTDTLAKALVETARKADESHALTVEIRDLLRAGKVSVTVIKWAAGVVGAISAIGAALHFWPHT